MGIPPRFFQHYRAVVFGDRQKVIETRPPQHNCLLLSEPLLGPEELFNPFAESIGATITDYDVIGGRRYLIGCEEAKNAPTLEFGIGSAGMVLSLGPHDYIFPLPVRLVRFISSAVA